MDQSQPDSIGAQVRERRHQKNYTQQELADLAGISLRSVQRIERDEVIPRDYTLRVLEEKLEMVLRKTENQQPAARKSLNLSQKVVLTVSLALVIILLASAYVFQSPTFPESAFELTLYIAALVGVYALLLLVIWK